MRRLKKNFRELVPYTPGDQPQFADKVKLNTNENPYPPAPEVVRALKEFDAGSLRLYPDPSIGEAVHAIAEYHGVNDDNVFVGVGSDDVLATCFMAFFNSGKPIMFPDITYAFYKVWAELFKVKYTQVPLDDNFKINPERYRNNGGVVFPNPNAPTGIFESRETVKNILENNRDVVVIVDEAYIDFGGESVTDLIPEYDNLVVTRTFSKSRSLAGMRIGYAVSNPALIAELNKIKYSYNSYTLTSPAIKAAAASVANDEYFKSVIGKIIATREETKKRLADLDFEFFDSKANFIFARHKSIPAKELFEALRQEHIYVRYFPEPRIDNYLRITIGTDEEMDKFFGFLERYMEKRA